MPFSSLRWLLCNSAAVPTSFVHTVLQGIEPTRACGAHRSVLPTNWCMPHNKLVLGNTAAQVTKHFCSVTLTETHLYTFQHLGHRTLQLEPKSGVFYLQILTTFSFQLQNGTELKLSWPTGLFTEFATNPAQQRQHAVADNGAALLADFYHV